MFNCSKCWENPCTCGNEYSHLTVPQLEKLIKTLEGVIKDRLYEDYKKDQSWDGPGNR